MRSFELNSKDGLALRGKAWSPEAPRAAVALAHGLGEHVGRYEHVGEFFAARGVSFHAIDLRGHGLSDGRRGHAANYDVLMDDIQLLLDRVRMELPNTPLFLYGHSLGGNIALAHAMKRRPALAGVIATAPLLRLAFEPPKWKTALMTLLYRCGVSLTLPSGVGDDDLSKDDEVVRKKRADSLSHKKVSTDLAGAMLEHGEWLLQHAADFPYPILLIHGDEDNVTSCAASAEFAAALKVEHVFKVCHGARHEPHNEVDNDEILELMLEWITRRAAEAVQESEIQNRKSNTADL